MRRIRGKYAILLGALLFAIGIATFQFLSVSNPLAVALSSLSPIGFALLFFGFVTLNSNKKAIGRSTNAQISITTPGEAFKDARNMLFAFSLLWILLVPFFYIFDVGFANLGSDEAGAQAWSRFFALVAALPLSVISLCLGYTMRSSNQRLAVSILKAPFIYMGLFVLYLIWSFFISPLN